MSSTLSVRELSNPSLFISCKFFNWITLCNYCNKYFWKGNVSTSCEKLAKTFDETIYFKGRNFWGQKLSRFSRIFDIFTKVYYLEHATLQILKSFFSPYSYKVAIRESVFSISNHFFNARRSFIHQKVYLICRALSELFLFFYKMWNTFFYFFDWNDNDQLSFFQDVITYSFFIEFANFD